MSEDTAGGFLFAALLPLFSPVQNPSTSPGEIQRDSRAADDAGVVAEFGRDDFEVAAEGRGQLRGHFFLERTEDDRAGFGDAAADDDAVGIEEPYDGGEGGGELSGEFVPDLKRDGITAARRSGKGAGLAVFRRDATAGFG